MTSANEADCAVRALRAAGGGVRVLTRDLALEVEGQLSLAPKARHPSALDLLLAALASDLLAGFLRAAARAGITLDEVELSLVARLRHPLVALGVVGERGSPALAAVTGSLDIATLHDEASLRDLWQAVQARSVVHATLACAASLQIPIRFY